MTLPNFLIIGVGKAGTTSVYNYLRQHPDVFVSPIKEPHGGVTYLPPKTLTPRPENARTHSSKQLERLCAAIARFGFLNPDPDRWQEAGDRRARAARGGQAARPRSRTDARAQGAVGSRAAALCHPEREPLAVLEQQKAAMGSQLFAAQYQQAPVPAAGNLDSRCQGLGMVKLTGLY